MAEFWFTLEFTSSVKKRLPARSLCLTAAWISLYTHTLSKSCRPSDQENMYLNTWLSYMF